MNLDELKQKFGRCYTKNFRMGIASVRDEINFRKFMNPLKRINLNSQQGRKILVYDYRKGFGEVGGKQFYVVISYKY